MACLVWMVRKIRHISEAAKAEKTTVIFTDRAANTSIIKETTFASNIIDKLNFLLVRTSIYLSQFCLNVKYRPGKKRVIPDALSRLFSGNRPVDFFNPPRNFPADSLNLDTYFCGVLNPSDHFDN